ncbi:MAG: hypothetical protein ACYDIE_13700 [Candidatus Krumholzibacteriia bacterium]
MMDSHQTTTTAPARTCRVLYFGPPGSGKTANLAQIASCVPQAYRVPVGGSAGGERFGFRVDAGDLGPWIVETVAADAAAVGSPAAAGRGFPFDGVVFVADSSADRLDLNLSALETLKTDLEAGGFDLTSLPMVIQYNRQDAPGRLPVDRLESLLNPWGMPSFPAVASQGVGVRETLRAVLGLTMRQLDRAASAPEESARSGADRAAGPAGVPAAASAASAAPTPATGSLRVAAVPAPAAGDDRILRIEPDERDDTMFAARRPPVVVPVRVPRSLLERHGTVRIVLELEVDGRGTGVD